MEVRKDFGDRMEALAHELPPQAIKALLKAFLPRRAVSTRAADPVPAGAPLVRAADGSVVMAAGNPLAKLSKKGGAKRTRAPRGFVKYEVLNPLAHRKSRADTWRRARTEAAIRAEPQTSLHAQNWLRDNYPQFADRTIPWTRLVEDGVIRIIR